MQTFPATKLGKPSKNTRLVEPGFRPGFFCAILKVGRRWLRGWKQRNRAGLNPARFLARGTLEAIDQEIAVAAYHHYITIGLLVNTMVITLSRSRPSLLLT